MEPPGVDPHAGMSSRRPSRPPADGTFVGPVAALTVSHGDPIGASVAWGFAQPQRDFLQMVPVTHS